MTEERRRILGMVAEGKLSVEEAEELLDAVDAPAVDEQPREVSGEGRGRGFADELKEEIFDTLEESLRGIGDQVRQSLRSTTVVRPRRHPRRHRRRGGAVDKIIQLASMGVSPEYVEKMRDAGLGDLSTGEVVELSSLGVTPEFVEELREVGLGDLTVREVVELSQMGVTPDFIAGMRDAGFSDITVDDVVRRAVEDDEEPDEDA